MDKSIFGLRWREKCRFERREEGEGWGILLLHPADLYVAPYYWIRPRCFGKEKRHMRSPVPNNQIE